MLAEVTVVGKYTSTSFEVISGISGSVAIIDPAPGLVGGFVTLAATANGGPAPANGAGNVALLGNYMASLFAAPEGPVGAQTATAETAQSQPALTHPHTH